MDQGHRPLILGSLAQEQVAGDLPVGCLSAGHLAFDVRGRTQSHPPRLPGFDPTAPGNLTAGGWRGATAAPTRAAMAQMDGPEETHDELAALTGDFGRTLDNRIPLQGSSSVGVYRTAKRRTTSTATGFVRARDPRFSLCRTIRTRSRVGRVPRFRASVDLVDLSNAGLESFMVKDFTAPPMVWGNFDTLLPMVYPDTSIPAGSDRANRPIRRSARPPMRATSSSTSRAMSATCR